MRHQQVVAQIRVLMQHSLEIEVSELAELDNQADLLGAPLFLDSIDMLQLIADCERHYCIKLYPQRHTLRNCVADLATLIISQLGQTQTTQRHLHRFMASDGCHYDEAGLVDLLNRVLSFSPELARQSKTEEVQVAQQNAIAQMLTVFSLLLSGRTPVLGGNDGLSWQQLCAGTDSDEPATPHCTGLDASLMHRLGNARVGFLTSGSTGKPSLFFKSLHSMWSEAEGICQSLDLSGYALINALISPQHMYGFIWTWLIPIRLNKPVFYQDAQYIDASPCGELSMLNVLVPSVWDLLAHEDLTSGSAVVSSGAPFGARREAEFATLQKTIPQLSGIEVLGSTETGGIGFRAIAQDSIATFTLFSEVQLRLDDEGTAILRSPYLLSDHSEFVMMDRIALLGDGRIRHLGRKDKVFKYKGKRLSLEEAKQRLQVFFGTAPLKLFFVEDDNDKRGGQLLAFVETQSQQPPCEQALRDAFRDYPVPNIALLPSFPLNQMGKTTLSSLLEVTHAKQ
ncbi:hypothetical protein [Pseudoalteromonas sp. R3]|uniref:hypothetical protein n=1 Tax=Pseudoalteromonas sp. R3 TaxID=1709477 RepID=UPI0006B475E0|nr:hypothetical protein [Pseudoalteromonas sp. R3]AZZ96244.1 hypothetical protein ELR70_03335 [Pseudoalteromonas sp. R3]